MMIELDILAISSRMIPIKQAMIQNGMGNNENPGRLYGQIDLVA
jgi:hypothetical protein